MAQETLNLKKIKDIASQLAGQQGYSLFDVACDKEHTGKYLRIYIDTDREGGITLDDCERYHRAVQPMVEDYDYDFLEVCSPGADRPVRDPEEARRYAGSLVDVKLYKPVNGSKEYCLPLEGMTDSEVMLKLGEETLTFDRASVASVRLHPDLSGLDEEE
ncbi:MAG: hypothetical protein CW338_04000 [Clostridiales bacterium]|nr:hypothetical protein [Clostridiales bacterium]